MKWKATYQQQRNVPAAAEVEQIEALQEALGFLACQLSPCWPPFCVIW